MPRHVLSRLMMCAALAAACLALPFTTTSVFAQQAKPGYPNLSFARELSGSDAVSALGGNLPAVAAWHGMTADELRNAFLNGRCCATAATYVLGTDGRIRIRETFPVIDQFLAIARVSPAEDTFKLHSNPGARQTIYLRFPEQYQTGNGVYQVQSVFRRVADDFSPFDVDVTTEFVPDKMAYRTGSDGPTFGYIVDIVQKPAGSGSSVIGEVTLKSFDDRSDATRRLTVTASAPNDSLPEIISHLLGHALGLRDDEVDTTGSRQLYDGHPTQMGRWVPIMGYSPVVRENGNLPAFTQFSRGEYDGALNKTDSLAAIQQIIPLRADDVGDTLVTAKKLPLNPQKTRINLARTEGIIGRQGDKDVYLLNVGAGELYVDLQPPVGGGNVNLSVRLFDANGQAVANSVPLNGKPSNAPRATFFSREMKSGTYYLEVSAVGVDDPRTNGFSEYGSIGQYSVFARASYFLGSPPVASLSAAPASGAAPLSVSLDASGSTDDRKVQFVYWDFGDGTKDTTGSLRSLNKTYGQPGTYPVTIRVVDDEGLSDVTTKTIQVNAALPQITAKVDLRLLSLSRSSSAAFGTLYVVDAAGKRLPNATVRYSWSGLQQGQRTITSQAQGSTILSLASSQTGCFTLTVTGITLPGYSFNAGGANAAQVCR